MKLPDFRVGDVVMLQSGSRYFTITEIDDDNYATCIASTSHDGMAEHTWPLRALVRLNDVPISVKEGDHVMCRSTCTYMTVQTYLPESNSAVCSGEEVTREISLAQLVKLHVRYE